MTKLIIYIILLIGTILLGLLWFRASDAAPNPQYIPLIHACSNYDDTHCSREFKRVLQLYEYQVCKKIENDTCVYYYTPEELHIKFNTLNGWVD